MDMKSFTYNYIFNICIIILLLLNISLLSSILLYSFIVLKVFIFISLYFSIFLFTKNTSEYMDNIVLNMSWNLSDQLENNTMHITIMLTYIFFALKYILMFGFNPVLAFTVLFLEYLNSHQITHINKIETVSLQTKLVEFYDDEEQKNIKHEA